MSLMKELVKSATDKPRETGKKKKKIPKKRKKKKQPVWYHSSFEDVSFSNRVAYSGYDSERIQRLIGQWQGSDFMTFTIGGRRSLMLHQSPKGVCYATEFNKSLQRFRVMTRDPPFTKPEPKTRRSSATIGDFSEYSIFDRPFSGDPALDNGISTTGSGAALSSADPGTSAASSSVPSEEDSPFDPRLLGDKVRLSNANAKSTDSEWDFFLSVSHGKPSLNSFELLFEGLLCRGVWSAECGPKMCDRIPTALVPLIYRYIQVDPFPQLRLTLGSTDRSISVCRGQRLIFSLKYESRPATDEEQRHLSRGRPWSVAGFDFIGVVISEKDFTGDPKMRFWGINDNAQNIFTDGQQSSVSREWLDYLGKYVRRNELDITLSACFAVDWTDERRLRLVYAIPADNIDQLFVMDICTDDYGSDEPEVSMYFQCSRPARTMVIQRMYY